MPNNGIMKEIRSLLDQEKSRAEIIALGFKPSTVSKAQRQLRQENPKSEEMPLQDMTAVVAANSDPQEWSEPKEEDSHLNQQWNSLEEQATEIASLQKKLAQTLDRIAQLEVVAGEVPALREQAAALEPTARSADKWQKKYRDLEDRLGHTVAAMGQEVQDWQSKFTEEQNARKGAEALADQHSAEVASLRESNRELQQRLQSLPDRLAQELWELVQPLNDELEDLRPLKVWAGHSCTPQ